MWLLIAGRLPGSTCNKIKNYWNTHIKQKLFNRGLDPQTHRPLNQIHNHNNFNKYIVNNNEEIMHSSTHYQENLDLELSIGLASSESADSRPLQQRQQPQQQKQVVGYNKFFEVKQAVCLCWQLGFGRSELFKNCTQNSSVVKRRGRESRWVLDFWHCFCLKCENFAF